MIPPMRPLPLLVLLLSGCASGAPCAWTVTNDTGFVLQTVRYVASSGFEWSEDVLADIPLPPSESVAFDVDGGTGYDLQGFASGGRSYTRINAITCEDGEAHSTILGGSDRDL
jgi:hypothetical protein